MKLLCKKDYKQGSNDEIFIYHVGKEYFVNEVKNDLYYIRSEYYDVNWIFGTTHKNVSDGYLYDYFYKPEEIRKMKLKSLC
ncbi:hypothetical protein M0Q50_07455 [bacterium]|jgi:hypothetical protein|nr:hypothetical protein [bacterium]